MAIELKAADGGTVQVSPEILQVFKAGFAGAVLHDDEAYEQTRQIWNAMIDRRPGLIVRCRGTADVVRAVRFANRRQFLISVRGGGHNIAGLAVCEGGLMIDISLMTGVWDNPASRTARAQAGCTLADVEPGDAAAWSGGGARFCLGDGHRRSHGRRGFRLSHAQASLDLRHRALDGGGHRRRQGRACFGRRERRAVLGLARWQR